MKAPLALRLAIAVHPDLADNLRGWRSAGVPWPAMARMLAAETDGVIDVTDTTLRNWARALEREQVAS